MTILTPIALYGWILFGIFQFKRKDPKDAAIAVVVGGILFLPVYGFPIPFIQEYDKTAAIAASLIIGVWAARPQPSPVAKMSLLDLPMILWCFLSPMATSLSNGLGFYNGLTSLTRNVLSWGVFYWAGRRIFTDAASMRKLTVGLIVGSLIYIPFIAFEIRMSPQLSRMIYGFFPATASFDELFRYGGYRPLVFMQHGLMLALWITVAALTAFFLWRARSIQKIGRLSMGLITVTLLVVAVLCRSVGALALLAAGLFVCLVVLRTKSPLLLKALLVVVIVYISFRLSNILPISTLERLLEKYLDPQRVQSAMTRLLEEDLFGARARLRPYFGWGGYRRGWPIDPVTGKMMLIPIDSLWIIQFSTYGYLGLISSFLSLGIGPWKIFGFYSKARAKKTKRYFTESMDAIALSLVLAIYLLDSLSNGMHNAYYILCAGALVSYSKTLDLSLSAAQAPPIEES